MIKGVYSKLYFCRERSTNNEYILKSIDSYKKSKSFLPLIILVRIKELKQQRRTCNALKNIRFEYSEYY